MPQEYVSFSFGGADDDDDDDLLEEMAASAMLSSPHRAKGRGFRSDTPLGRPPSPTSSQERMSLSSPAPPSPSPLVETDPVAAMVAEAAPTLQLDGKQSSTPAVGGRFKLGAVRRASLAMGKPPAPTKAGTFAGRSASAKGQFEVRTSRFSKTSRHLVDAMARPESAAPALPHRQRRSSMWKTAPGGAQSEPETVPQPPQEPPKPGYTTTASEKRTMSTSSWLRFFVTQKPQVILLAVLHAVATCIVFLHFFLVKWRQAKASVPDGAPNYWQKRLVPPIEFGSMHVLLLQFAVLPLTMSKLAITKLHGTVLYRFLPLDALLHFHQYIGLFACVALGALFLLFMAHFGVLCVDHKAGVEATDFCAKFTEEIMLTGYGIMAIVAVLCVTSLPKVRRHLPYEAFYYTHHLFNVFYALVIAHTLDETGRESDSARSQTWKWVAAPFLIYLTDRFLRYRRTRRAKLVEAHVLKDPKALILQLRMPPGNPLRFQAGQYVYVNAPGVSKLQWHPFAIQSSPRTPSKLELFVQVESCKPGGTPTWTEALFDTVCSAASGGPPVLYVEGPYSAGDLPGVLSHKHALLVATGTGVVPMISLLRDIAGRGKVILGNGGSDVLVVDNVRQPPAGKPGSSVAPVPATTPAAKRVIKPAATAHTHAVDDAFNRMVASPYGALRAWLESVGREDRIKAARRSVWTSTVMLGAAVVDIGLAAGQLSWAHSKPPTGGDLPWHAASLVSLGLVLVYAWAAVSTKAASPAGRFALDVVLGVLMVAVEAVAWGDTLPSSGILAAVCLLRVYRALWHVVQSPLFAQRVGGNPTQDASSKAFLSSVSFLWATSSYDAFVALAPALDEALSILDVTTQDPSFLDVAVNVRGLTPVQKLAVLRQVEGTALEGSVCFGAPCFAASLEAMCALKGKDKVTGVAYCGNRTLAKSLRVAVASADWSGAAPPLVFASEYSYME